MKVISFILLIASFLSACGLAPKPKQPNNWNRVPINKTLPAETQ
ncbi:TrwH protein [Bartonella harrusi]|uniref:TrwH protein n=1 Tax=Bartonella harrusi TaxID=2961895 RepID=A0ABY5EV90_9HYPH|nr:TrwH protein [Bartonella harrusi]UTO28305.1 TrwH protein [Bartonella harrusi]UTO28308.1 TrwH protein [Bartonella harrusi]